MDTESGHRPMTGEALTALGLCGLLVLACGAGAMAWVRFRRLQAASAALRESERRYRRIAESAGDLVAMLDRNGRWLYVSPSHARIFRAADIAIGGDAFCNVHEEDQFRVRGALQVVVRSGESCRLRMRLHTVSGGVRRFESLVHPVREEGADVSGAGKRITGAVMAFRDVTELRDREEQQEIAAHAFERMAEAMMITSAAGRILAVNQSFTRVTGHAPAAAIGRPESEFRTAMQPDSFYDDLYATVLRAGHWQGTTWCRRRDGSLYREWRSVSAVRDADGRVTHYVALFRELAARGADPVPQDRPAKSA